MTVKDFKIPEQAQADIGFDETDEGLVVTIDTQRLRLTSVTEKEKELYHTHLYGDKKVMEQFATGVTRTSEEVQGLVDTWITRWKLKNPFSSLVVNKEDDEFVGQVVLGPGDNSGESELAYLFAKKHWKQGFGTEAVDSVVNLYAYELAKKKCKIEGQQFTTLTATAHIHNVGSNKILQKVGMTCENQEEKFGGMRNHYRKTVG